MSASADGTTATSSRVAISTVMGMVLGVFALFGLIISYQLIPRSRKPSSSLALKALAPPAPKPIPFFKRLRTRCTTLVQTIFRRQPPDQRQPGTHRTMRSFHLTPERRQQRDAMRAKFASTLRVNVHLPFKGRSEKASPRTPIRSYKRLKGDDLESHAGLLKPDTALLSPWSSGEDFYPITPPPLFTASPLSSAGPSSPPPAYVPSTPLRSRFDHHRPDSPSTKTHSFSTTTDDTAVDDHENKKGPDETKLLLEEVDAVIQFTREWARERQSTDEDPFVVADDDDDAASDVSSDWGTTSV